MSYGPPPPTGGFDPPGYDPPGYGPPNGFGLPGQPPASQGLVIGAMLTSAVGLFALCVLFVVLLPLPIISLVLSALAMAQRESNPAAARILAILAYALVGGAFLLGVLIFGAFTVNDMMS